jgi:class 3 adenylate cyclase
MWGTGEAMSAFFINHAPDADAAVRAMAKFERNACTPQMAAEILRRNLEIDVRALLPGIAVPTLVLHNRGDPLIPAGCGRYLADNIPGAAYAEGDGEFHGTWLAEESGPLIARTLAFLGEEPPPDGPVPGAPPQRAVATILFTDIVGSTDRAAAMGDRGWTALLEQHHGRAAAAARRAGGTLVKTTGDGVLALFDGPSRAIAAVRELRQHGSELGIQLRAGIHTGEVERTGHDIAGIAVHIAARVMALAAADEVLASRTARDLAAGSGIEFTERGTEVLRGVPGEWGLYAVRD